MLPSCRADVGRYGSSVVSLVFSPASRRKFAAFTLRNVKKHSGIFLDETPISVPVVEEPIPGGDGVIHGGFSLKEAQEMKDLLNAGTMPARLDVEQVAAVGSSR